MPFYDLKCRCGEEFNIMAKMSDKSDKLILCPKCGSNELETVFKSISVVQSRKPDSPECPNSHKCGGCCGHMRG